jgi:hypothetical protein
MALDRAEATASPELLREIAQFTSALQYRMDQRDLEGQRACTDRYGAGGAAWGN